METRASNAAAARKTQPAIIHRYVVMVVMILLPPFSWKGPARGPGPPFVAGLGTRQPVLRRTASIVVVLPTLPAASMARYWIV